MSSRRLSVAGLAVCSLLLALAPVARAAPDISEIKLFGKWTNITNPGNYVGQRVALSDKWALVGSYAASVTGSTFQGAVQVFNAATGAWVRKLAPPLPAPTNTSFGISMAVVGDLGVIGAYGVGSFQGAVYVYNLASGVLVRTLSASDGVSGDQFGYAVAAKGTRVLVGANGRASSKGAAYLFDLSTGLQLNRFDLDVSGVVNDNFGAAVAVDGNLGLIGAYGRSSSKGAAYLYDLTTFQLLQTLAPPSLVANDVFGVSVTLDGVHAVVGAEGRNSSQGAVFVFDARNGANLAEFGSADSPQAGDFFGLGLAASDGKLLVGAFNKSGQAGAVYLYDLGHLGFPKLTKITAIDAQDFQAFGQNCALCGNAALVGAPGFGGPNGSAYLLRPMISPLPLTKVVARGDLAPGLVDATFSVLGDAFINSSGEVAFHASLTGLGTAGGHTSGVWTSLRTPGSLQASHTAGDILGSASIMTLGTPIANEDSYAVYQVGYKVGTGGVTAANSKAIIIENGTNANAALTTGGLTTPFGIARIKDFTELVQTNRSGQDDWAVTCTLVPDPATFTTAANDSGVFVYPGLEGAREGTTIPGGGGDFYGQFSGRVSYHYTDAFFHAAATGLVTMNQVIMRYTPGSGAALVARKGAAAPLIAGATLSSLLGEAGDASNRVLYRATLAGVSPTVTPASNEALFTRTTGLTDGLALRKGQPIGVAGLTISRFVKAWPCGGNRALVLVVLAGPGVTAANDQALLGVMEDGSVSVLMREGQPAGGCTNATIGVISQVEVDCYSAGYAVIATLAGATVGADQALYTGGLYNGNSTTLVTLRRPFLFLRKGQVYDNQPGHIRSISLPVANVPASGVGSTGRGRAISWLYDFVVTIEFDNNVRQIMKGSLP